MNMEWSYPSLGKFVFVDEHWIKVCHLPSFDKFIYDAEVASDKPYELSFYAETEDYYPKNSATNLLKKIIINQEAIADNIIEVLWNDLKGIKCNSGMWWHGSFDEAFEEIGELPISPKQLQNHLELQSISIINATELDEEEPIAEISFRASFEEEHGVSFLSNGSDIIGSGYISSASLFK